MQENKKPETQAENAEIKNQSKRRHAPSGAYWYTVTDEAKLATRSFNRTALSVIALLLQIAVLMLPQGGLEYVTKNIPSYAYVYMWAVFVMLGVSVYVLIMCLTRYKLLKRIPVERAPKGGFKRRAHLCEEIRLAVYALIFCMELSFVCIHYDGIGLVGMFVSAAALAAAAWARQITHLTLKDAELIPPPDAEQND